MCTEIQVNGQFCRSIGELAAAIGRENISFSRGYLKSQLIDDTCLCPVNTDRTRRKLKMRLRWSHMCEVWEPRSVEQVEGLTSTCADARDDGARVGEAERVEEWRHAD